MGRVRVFAILLFGELHALTRHRAFVRVRMNNATVANGGFVFTSHHIAQSNTQHVEYVQKMNRCESIAQLTLRSIRIASQSFIQFRNSEQDIELHESTRDFMTIDK